METASEAATASDSGVRPAAPLTRALELIAQQCGVRLEPREAWEAAAEGVVSGRGDALRSFGLAARRAGLLVARPRELSAASLGALGTPALTWVAGPWGGWWVVVLERRARRYEVVILDEEGERRRWLPAATLELALARELEQPIEGIEQLAWLRVEPALPLAAVASGSTGEPGKLGPVRRLFALARLERDDLGVVLVYAVAVGGLTLAVPIAVQALVNTVAFGTASQPLAVLSLLLGLGLAFVAVLQILEALVVEAVQRRIFVRTAADFARRLQRLSAEARRELHGPELANRLFDVVTLQKAGAALLIDGLALVLQLVVGMALLAFYHPFLLAFDLFLLVAVALVVFVVGRGAVTTGVVESNRKYAVAAWIEGLAGSPLRFADPQARAFADARAEQLIRGWLRARRQHFARVLRQLCGGVGLQALAHTALLGLGGWLVIRRQLTLGQLVAAELVVTAIGSGLGKLGKHLETFYDACAAAAKIGKVVDTPLERRGGELLSGHAPLEVLVRERGDEGRIVLALAPGETLGLIGRTPTHARLCDLLFGLHDDPALDLRIDGCSLRSLDLEALRRELVLVRGVELIEASVRDNLDPRPIPSADSAIHEALELVGLYDRVVALPDGLHSPLLPSGAPLCEAEARRLMLAAALLRRPRLLLIDGGLDGLGLAADARERLLNHLFAADAPWTLIVVSEDPDLLQRCGARHRLG
ncbi:MAG: ABC transporter ATP-binding protein [Enhygromyxa sp.]